MSGAYNQDIHNRFFVKGEPLHQIYADEDGETYLMGLAINPHCKNKDKIFANYLIAKGLEINDFHPPEILYLEYNELSGEWNESDGSNPQCVMWYETRYDIRIENTSK